MTNDIFWDRMKSPELKQIRDVIRGNIPNLHGCTCSGNRLKCNFFITIINDSFNNKGSTNMMLNEFTHKCKKLSDFQSIFKANCGYSELDGQNVLFKCC